MGTNDGQRSLLNLPPRGAPPTSGLGWLGRAAAAAVAVVFTAVVTVQLVPASWWTRAGFANDPGFFVKRQLVNYDVCSPWQGTPKRDGTEDALGGSNWTARTVALDRKSRSAQNVGILLPKNAVIDAIYCGSTTAAGVTTECSMRGCDYPATLALDDDLYTRGRALTFSLELKHVRGLNGQAFQVWVKWRRPDSMAATASLEERR